MSYKTKSNYTLGLGICLKKCRNKGVIGSWHTKDYNWCNECIQSRNFMPFNQYCNNCVFGDGGVCEFAGEICGEWWCREWQIKKEKKQHDK